MMFPTVAAIGNKNIVEDHRTEPEHDDLADIANIESGVKAVRLKRLPALAILVAERRNLLAGPVDQLTRVD